MPATSENFAAFVGILKGLEFTLEQSSVVRVNKKCKNIELGSDSENYVTRRLFSDGTALEVSSRDLVVASYGYRSVLFALPNPSMKRPVSPVNNIVFSSYAPELAQRISNTFHKTLAAALVLVMGSWLQLPLK